MQVTAFVGLGANLGEPRQALSAAIAQLNTLLATRVIKASSFYRSAPLGYTAQPAFVNAVVQIETGQGAAELLDALLAIEARAGRQRSFANAPRPLDLDLLLYGDATVHADRLTVPHPRMHERRFVLEPLLEVAPDCVIPGRGRAADCLARIEGQAVEKMPERT